MFHNKMCPKRFKRRLYKNRPAFESLSGKISVKCVSNFILHCICAGTLFYNYDKVVQMGRIGHGDTG